MEELIVEDSDHAIYCTVDTVPYSNKAVGSNKCAAVNNALTH